MLKNDNLREIMILIDVREIWKSFSNTHHVYVLYLLYIWPNNRNFYIEHLEQKDPVKIFKANTFL
jgi:hypothetical protein